MNSGLRIGLDGRILNGAQRGMARYTRDLLSALARSAPENDYYLYLDHPLSTQSFEFSNVKIRILGRQPLWANTALAFAARSDRLDVMHFPYNTSWVVKVCPTIVTLHDVNPLLDLKYGLKNWLLYCYYLFSIFITANLVITDSEVSRSEISKLVPKLLNKCKVVYAGIEDGFRQRDIQKQIGKPYLLFIGGSDPNKNLLAVLKSMKLFQTQYDFEIPLVVVGKKINNKNSIKIAETIRELNISSLVTWSNTVTDEELITLYQNAASLVFPSFREGFGFPILEAMACGIPVITSNTSSMVEIAGGAAFLIDPHSPEDIARAIVTVCKDKNIHDKLVNSGLKRSSHFTWERTAYETLELYKSVLSVRRQWRS